VTSEFALRGLVNINSGLRPTLNLSVLSQLKRKRLIQKWTEPLSEND